MTRPNCLNEFPRLKSSPGDGGFLQVLIQELTLRRLKGEGLEVVITVDDDRPCLPHSRLKKNLAAWLDQQAGQKLEARAAEFRNRAAVGDTTTLHHESFCFRHASGGIFPWLDEVEPLALLFYRDIHPIGWNIANGASANRSELGALDAVIQREAEEEILFFDPRTKTLSTLAQAEIPSELEKALGLWQKKLVLAPKAPRRLDLQDQALGSDRLRVIDRQGTTIVTENLFLEIQAEDFGLEAARVARIAAATALIPLDGEILGGQLLDRPVGLFSRDALRQELPIPARWYQGGAPGLAAPPRAPLCPITRRLTRRLGTADG
ncbi:MAG: hypothetical protein V3W41_01355 [Planctomycetota bacterium]